MNRKEFFKKYRHLSDVEQRWLEYCDRMEREEKSRWTALSRIANVILCFISGRFLGMFLAGHV